MKQDAVITKKFNNGMAEVAVTRGTACGSNCGNCESCIYANELHALAVNKVNANVGQHVVLESKTSKIIKAEFFVYIMPLLFMIIGYLIPYSLGKHEGTCILICFIALLVSALLLVVTQKNKKAIQHVVVRIKE